MGYGGSNGQCSKPLKNVDNLSLDQPFDVVMMRLIGSMNDSDIS